MVDKDDCELLCLFDLVVVWQVGNVLFGILLLENVVYNCIVFKIGIFYGYCDVWLVGFDGWMIIGVWVGCLDGVLVLGLIGCVVVVFILFDVFVWIGKMFVFLLKLLKGILVVVNVKFLLLLKWFCLVGELV